MQVLGSGEHRHEQLISSCSLGQQAVKYWGRPNTIATTLSDGWVHNGDAGYVDATRR